jgi:haloalkane dehalogenase
MHRCVQDIPFEEDHPTRRTLAGVEAGLVRLQDHPMLILWGARDFVFTVKDFLAQWQRYFPHAETHIFPDAGHYVVEDAHERIIPLIKKFMAD